jgi:flagellar basal body-associated protein FliL
MNTQRNTTSLTEIGYRARDSGKARCAQAARFRAANRTSATIILSAIFFPILNVFPSTSQYTGGTKKREVFWGIFLAFFLFFWYAETMSRVHRILTIIACSLALLIAVGTGGSFLFHTATPGKNLRRSEGVAQVAKTLPPKTGYLSLGQIRSPLKGDALVVVSPWFTYDGEDRAFFEELSGKRQALRNRAAAFFSQRTPEELRGSQEALIKEDLCRTLNEELLLGKITRVYFEDYAVLD